MFVCYQCLWYPTEELNCISQSMANLLVCENWNSVKDAVNTCETLAFSKDLKKSFSECDFIKLQMACRLSYWSNFARS